MIQVATRSAGLAVALVATSASAESLTNRGDAVRRAALALRDTTVEVNAGQTLTEAVLLSGLFGDQSFTLAPDTTFDINDGGVIGPVGSQGGGLTPFDFFGSTVNINDGGRFESLTFPGGSVVTNLVLNLFGGGAVGDSFYALDGNTVHIDGGEIGRSFFARQSTVQLTDGVIGDGFAARDSVVQISGGVIGDDAAISDSTVLTITGGRVGDDFMVWGGSTANIEGGRFGAGFQGDGVVNLSGGSFGQNFQSDGPLTVSGAEFMLDGVAGSDLSGGLPGESVLTGTLADGTVFIFSNLSDNFRPLTNDRLAAGATSLHTVALAPADTTPIFVNSGEGPSAGLRAGQTLTLAGTATLRDHFAAVGSTLNIDGGSVGFGLETARSQINISGGVVGDNFTALEGSSVTISGGQVGDDFILAGGSLEMSGGSVGRAFSALNATVELTNGIIDGGATATDSQLTISGGSFTFGLRASRSDITVTGGSINQLIATDSALDIRGGRIGGGLETIGGSVTISGGTFGPALGVSSDLTLAGSEFMLNGAPIGEPPGTLDGDAVFSGTLADGSVFIFSSFANDFIPASTTLDAVALDPIDTTPVTVSSGLGPDRGLRSGQTLTLTGTGALRSDFAAVNATLNIEGGEVGDRLEIVGTDLHIAGGEIGVGADFYAGSAVHITGGTLGDGAEAFAGSTVRIDGGVIGDGFEANAGSVIEINGGAIGRGDFGESFRALAGSVINVRGGEFSDRMRLHAFRSSAIHLFVTDLSIDSVALDLAPGESVVIEARNGALVEAVLLDGSFLDFNLNTRFFSTQDFFDPDATLTVTRVPTPGAATLLALAGVLATRRRR